MYKIKKKIETLWLKIGLKHASVIHEISITFEIFLTKSEAYSNRNFLIEDESNQIAILRKVLRLLNLTNYTIREVY